MINIVFHNPHVIWFKDTVPSYLAGTRRVGKYDYLFDYIYKQNKKVSVLINNASSEPVFKGFLRKLNSPIIEFYGWLLLNRLNPLKFRIIEDAENLTENDCILSFIYGNFTNANCEILTPRESFFDNLKKTRAFKVVHLSHYGYNVSIGSKNTKSADIDLFLCENNLRKNSPFFQHFFNWYQNDVYTLPFVPQKRFISKTAFESRINKALATGTNTHKMKDDDYISFFNHNLLQPLRAGILENSHNLSEYIDSLINNIEQNFYQKERISFGTYLVKLLQYFTIDFYIFFSIIFRTKDRKKKQKIKNQRNYYNIDIVEKYNEYKMFVVPEEAIGIPGIGFIEGMACGCAYIGMRDPMYKDLGMIEGKHYIAYDGTIKDLVNQIAYYQANPVLLQEIALSGYNHVKENFTPDKVVKRLLNQLESKITNK